MAKEAAVRLADGVWRIPTAPGDMINSFALVGSDGGVTIVDAGLKLALAGKRLVVGLAAIGAAPGGRAAGRGHPRSPGPRRWAGRAGRADRLRGAGARAGVGLPARRTQPAADPARAGSRAVPHGGHRDHRVSQHGRVSLPGGLRAVHAPATRPGHTALLHEDSGVLFTGDARDQPCAAVHYADGIPLHRRRPQPAVGRPARRARLRGRPRSRTARSCAGRREPRVTGARAGTPRGERARAPGDCAPGRPGPRAWPGGGSGTGEPRLSRARRMVAAAAYGGGAPRPDRLRLLGLLLGQAKLARRVVGPPSATTAGSATAMYGNGGGRPLTIGVLGDSSAGGLGVQETRARPRARCSPPGSPRRPAGRCSWSPPARGRCRLDRPAGARSRRSARHHPRRRRDHDRRQRRDPADPPVGPPSSHLRPGGTPAAGRGRRGRRRHLPRPRHGRADPAAAAAGGPGLEPAARRGPDHRGGRGRRPHRLARRRARARSSRPGRRSMFGADRFHPSAAGYAAAVAVTLPSVCAAVGLWPEETDAVTDRRLFSLADASPVASAAARAAGRAGSEVSGGDVHGRASAARAAGGPCCAAAAPARSPTRCPPRRRSDPAARPQPSPGRRPGARRGGALTRLRRRGPRPGRRHRRWGRPHWTAASGPDLRVGLLTRARIHVDPGQ